MLIWRKYSEEERIKEFEIRSKEIKIIKTQREKKWNRVLRDLWDNIKQPNVHVISLKRLREIYVAKEMREEIISLQIFKSSKRHQPIDQEV